MAEPTTKNAFGELDLNQKQPRFFLGEDDFDGHVAVRLEAFLLFDHDMTHGLDNLERMWADRSTPNSRRKDIWENVER